MKHFCLFFMLLGLQTVACWAAIEPDSTRLERRNRALDDLFTDSTQLEHSDYQLKIENTFVLLNNVENTSEPGLPILTIREAFKDSDSILNILKDNILHNNSALNLRNLQIFNSLLQNIQSEQQSQRALLDSTDKKLTGLRDDLKKMQTDTVLRQLLRDSSLRAHFGQQLKELGTVARSTMFKLKKSINEVNQMQAHISSNSITTVQLQEKVNALLTTAAIRIFSKEHPYVWEGNHLAAADTALRSSSFAKVYDGERKALGYYFKDSGLSRLLLLVIGGLFFWWIYQNRRVLRRYGAEDDLKKMEFKYLTSGIWIAALVMMFSIVPLFDLHAPSSYIEFMQFILLIILTFLFWRKWPRDLFRNWIPLFVLYICFAFTQRMADPGIWQRLLLIGFNIGSIFFGLRFMSKMRRNLRFQGFLKMVVIVHNVLNGLAIVANIWGRVSLSQIMGDAAIFSLVQAIALSVFSQIFLEAIQLQVVASRVKLGVAHHDADYRHILVSFRNLILFVITVLWIIVFSNNLNIYNWILEGLGDFLYADRHLGNASFTFGGIVLFFLIIWVAHLLQRYVGYFFGDIDTEEELHDKKQRSRILILKLILLCVGYLLAVAASGIPIDKITIVIGALGVGIGLGLQDIVNNFVSGIVLIFDRPLQIGDFVEIGEKEGKIREIGLRSSKLLTDDGAEVIIPNGDILSQQIVNWTLTNNQQRLELVQRISGNTDIEQVASAVKKGISASTFVNSKREPQVLFIGVHETGFDVRVFFWTFDVNDSDDAQSDALAQLYKELKNNNMTTITIPEEERPM